MTRAWRSRDSWSLARESLPYLPDRAAHGIFLQNGSRLYVDCGGHPELATPELANPWDACRYALAGDRILSLVADQLAAGEKTVKQVVHHPLQRLLQFRRAKHLGEPRELRAPHVPVGVGVPEDLIPHLVSRVIYTGAGGFDNRSPASSSWSPCAWRT